MSSAVAEEERMGLLPVGALGSMGGPAVPPPAPSPSQLPTLPAAAAQPDSSQVSWYNFICHSSHPGAAAGHVIFKACALFLYLFGPTFGMTYVSVCVTAVLLLAFDFWTVKNITGRLLVGLRWWVRENEWTFESAPTYRPPPLDSRIFWWGLYITPVVWALFALLCLLKLTLDWLLIDLVGVGLTGANLVGYFKCSADAQKKLRSSIASGAVAGLSMIPNALPAIGSTFMSLLTRSNGSASSAAAAPARPAPLV